MQLDHIRFAKSPFYFWPILHVLCFPLKFWISFHTVSNSSGAPWDSYFFLIRQSCFLLELSTKDRTKSKLYNQQTKKVNITRLDSVNKVQDWEPDTIIYRLKFKTVARNTEHKLLVKSQMEISSNLVAFSQNTNFMKFFNMIELTYKI